MDVVLFFECSFFDEDGNEVFFASPNVEPDPGIGFFIDKDNGYITKNDGNSKYTVKFKPDEAIICENLKTSISIPFEDGVELLKKNYDLFNTSANRPVGSTWYSMRDTLLPEEIQCRVILDSFGIKW